MIQPSESGRLGTSFYDDDRFVNDDTTILSVLRVSRNSIFNIELQMDCLFVCLFDKRSY